MRRRAGGVILVAALVVGGCGAGADVAALSPTSTSALGTGTPAWQEFTPAPDGMVNEDTGEVVGAHPEPAWDEASRADAVAAAGEVMECFARPSLDHETWWADLEPLLSAEARDDYSFVDPRNVPASSVTGPAVLVDDTSAYIAVVEVPTDVGVYTLTLSRLHGDAPWSTERIVPPDGVN
jgi:hypothetical protein